MDVRKDNEETKVMKKIDRWSDRIIVSDKG